MLRHYAEYALHTESIGLLTDGHGIDEGIAP